MTEQGPFGTIPVPASYAKVVGETPTGSIHLLFESNNWDGRSIQVALTLRQAHQLGEALRDAVTRYLETDP